jgi:flagellar basal-body rod protein FlgF
MDRLIYTSMTGASHVLEQQATVAQNLSNVNTTGFRALIDTFRAVPLVGEGLPTRTFVVDSSAGTDFSQGGIQQTGSNLDVAIQGQGWFAVQMPDGSEAYTRNGSLQVAPNGTLQTRNGLNVAGDNNGPITIPPNTEIAIGNDGTISTVPSGSTPRPVTIVGRLKLVNPPLSQLTRGDDGLFRLQNGNAAPADANVNVVAGALEGSNTNTMDALVNMISLSRSFDMQMKMLTSADDNAKQAESILNVS